MISSVQIEQFTYYKYGLEKLLKLCEICEMAHKIPEIVEIFGQMTSHWGNTVLRKKPLWFSNIADDHTPFEFSVVHDTNLPELRILCEAQQDGFNLLSNWRAGMELNYWLMDNYGANLTRLNQVSDLFFPEDEFADFAMWHGACFWADKKPEFKIYLNPQAKGKELTNDIMKEALKRLGFKESWAFIEAILKEQDSTKSELKYFSLDMSAKTEARVKIYLRQHDISTDELEKMYSVAHSYVPGDVTQFTQAIANTTLLSRRPICSCFSFIESDVSNPNTATIQIPLSDYVTNDAVMQKRIHKYFVDNNFPVSIYDKSIEAVAKRSLDTDSGIHSYISFRRDRKLKPRVTTYFALESHLMSDWE